MLFRIWTCEWKELCYGRTFPKQILLNIQLLDLTDRSGYEQKLCDNARMGNCSFGYSLFDCRSCTSSADGMSLQTKKEIITTPKGKP
jgi:hypothetical protein